MKVLNIHKRIVNQPLHKVSQLLSTLSTDDDKIWPDQWPEMKFEKGIQIGAKGGHGPIRYTVEQYKTDEIIEFRFSKPEGFNGVHKFEIKELGDTQTEVMHVIDMNTSGTGTIKWILAIRSLHNALLEDGLDKMENKLSGTSKSTQWNLWVRWMRKLLS